MIERVIGVTELQRHFRKVLDEVVHEGTPYILTRGSRPQAVILSYDEYRQSRQAREREVLERVDRLLERMAVENAQYTEEEVMADIEAAREEVYDARLAKAQGR